MFEVKNYIVENDNYVRVIIENYFSPCCSSVQMLYNDLYEFICYYLVKYFFNISIKFNLMGLFT